MVISRRRRAAWHPPLRRSAPPAWKRGPPVLSDTFSGPYCVSGLPRPEEAFEISALDRGAVIHGILEAYFQRTSVSRCDSTASRRLAMQEAIEEGLKRAEAVYVTGRRVMWHLERERITRDLLAFVDQESERCAERGLAQRHAEFRFGIGQTGPGPVSVELPGLGTVRFRGVIDRVETNDDGSEAVVVDYKTGSASAYSALKDDPIDHGMRLQLPIYAEAVRAAFPSARSVAAQYWFVSERGGYRLIPDPPVSARGDARCRGDDHPWDFRRRLRRAPRDTPPGRVCQLPVLPLRPGLSQRSRASLGAKVPGPPVGQLSGAGR